MRILVKHLPKLNSKRALFWVGVAIALLAAPALLFSSWYEGDQERLAEARQRAVIMTSADALLQARTAGELLIRAGVDQRGFLVRGDPALLGQSRQDLVVAKAAVAKLPSLFQGEPDQLARVAELQAETTNLSNWISTLPATPAQRQPLFSRYDALVERLHVLTEVITTAEQTRAQASLAAADRLAHRAQVLTGALEVLVLAALAGAGFLAFRYTSMRAALVRRVTADAARRQAIFDSTMDAIVTIDPGGAIESLNHAAEEMFGYTEAELVGQDIAMIAPLTSRADGSLGRPGEDEPLQVGKTYELQGHRKDGSPAPIDVNLGRMEQPDGAHVVAVMRDATERKRAERTKDEFVSTVSHELRTPLTSIAGSLGLLAGGAAGPLPTKAERLINIAETNSRRLVRLINDILDIEKIQSGSMQFILQPVELGDLVYQAIEGVGGLHTEFDVAFQYQKGEEPLLVNGDADRLMQVVTNLLSNAAKFSPRGGAIEVSVTHEGPRARIQVRDSGPGIAPEFRNRIFGKFAQADSSDTRSKSGTGLGLAITKEIVERHGGRIWFDSPPGAGATFFVELPLAVLPQPMNAAAEPMLLLCEDDPGVAQLISEALDLEGFRVRWTATLAEAEAALSESQGYSALLLDLRLPDGNGLDLLRKLRAEPSTHALPVIVISADPISSAAGSLDIVDWIEKPLDLNRLKGSLRQVASAHEEPPVLLHIDDDPDLRQLVVEAFAGHCTLFSADSLRSARKLLTSVTPQLVILDIGLPDGSGLDLLPELIDPNGYALPVVIFSAHNVDRGALTDAVDAVLTKSRTSLSHLVRTVRMLVNKGAHQIPNQALAEAPSEPPGDKLHSAAPP